MTYSQFNRQVSDLLPPHIIEPHGARRDAYTRGYTPEDYIHDLAHLDAISPCDLDDQDVLIADLDRCIC